MTDDRHKQILFLIPLIAVIAILLCWYIHICRSYPYYFMWDMDHLTILDTVLIHSGLLPDHMHHTSFGMLLALCFSQMIGSLVGSVSILNLQDVVGALNPLGAMAELTDFGRIHSPFLAVGMILLLCMSFYLMFNMSRWYILFFVLIVGTQESLTFHSSMIRSEFYSLFYWSGAVLALTLAAKSESALWRLVFLLLMGVLSGLSFLTKAQSLFYVASLPFFFFIIYFISQKEQKNHAGGSIRSDLYCITAASLLSILFFSYIHHETYTGSGLSWLTKVQWLFFALSVPFVFFIILTLFQGHHKDNWGAVSRKKVYCILGINLINISVFSLLSIYAYRAALPYGIPLWATGFSFTRITVLFFSVLLVLLLYEAFLVLTNRIGSSAFQSCFYLSIIVSGFLLCFGFHFLLYSDASVSFYYMLVDFKMLFLRKVNFLELNSLYEYWSNFLLYFHYNPVPFIVSIVMNIILVSGYYFGFIRISKKALLSCVVVTFIAYINIFIGTRYILRDILYKEILLNFLSLFYFCLISYHAAKHRLILKRVSGLLLFFFIIV